MLREIRAVTLDEFGILPSIADGCVVLRLNGTGEGAAVDALRACLADVQSKILAHQVSAVEFDMRSLVLLNSSCLKVFASFLIPLVNGKSTCPIRFVVDSKQPWQSRSLFALERLAGNIVTIVPR